MRFHFYLSLEHLFIGVRKCTSCMYERYTQHWYICILPTLTIQISYEIKKPEKPTTITELY